MLHGLLDLPVWALVAITLIFTHITIAAVTIFLHRHQAHRALDLHPIISHFFRFWLWLTTGMMTREWVAIHRKHHAACETPEDPHSPQIFGIQRVLWQGAELYRASAKDKALLEKYGNGTPNDWIERHLYTPYSLIGVLVMLFIDVLLFGVLGLTIWAVQMVWIPFFAAGVVNGLGHWWGYRNYECADASTNLCPWGILIGGEELHNNHHTFASSAKLSSRPWEFDIGWFYIQLLAKLGLAQVKKVAPPAIKLNPNPRLEDVCSLLHQRFPVMLQYAQQVIDHVYRQELKHANGDSRTLLKRARALLIREESLLDDQEKSHLQHILAQNHALETVYQYRLRLQNLWQHTTANQELLLQSLQEWCRQAEASGVQALQEFAQLLRRYTNMPATA
ncbi:DesA family fatty acid desaturase [Thioflexithrix psekupsensis]|uniref:Acyl-CoA desaturase n=1 Tax=Thioflexithrix psekupsensis TaxID=1570016 RepID=A0A251XBX1_9GAMM|nr:fatty acid desaturase [Thioflexithrix psekupsensis]OUD16017.1 acyl-CoA desaturase [Thioflexithrix psekupsensis]